MNLRQACVIAAQADLSRFPHLTDDELRDALDRINDAIKAMMFGGYDACMDPTTLPN